MANYLFIDCETTGLGKNAAVIELACIPIVDGEEMPHFHSMIRPHQGATLDPKAFEITKIDINEIWTYPDAKGVLNEFFKWIKSFDTKFSLAGHNISFDRRMLHSLCCRNAEYGNFITSFRDRDLDTLKLAREVYKNKKDKPSSFALDELCSYFSIKNEVSHRALSDIQATIKVFHELDKLITKIKDPQKELSYEESVRKYMDIKYIQKNPEGDVFITREAMGDPIAMRFILNELYELTCDHSIQALGELQ